MPTLVQNNTLSVVLTDATGKQLGRATAASGERGLKQALLILAKRDVLAAGDL
jgi:hypothetical protein